MLMCLVLGLVLLASTTHGDSLSPAIHRHRTCARENDPQIRVLSEDLDTVDKVRGFCRKHDDMKACVGPENMKIIESRAPKAHAYQNMLDGFCNEEFIAKFDCMMNEVKSVVGPDFRGTPETVVFMEQCGLNMTEPRHCEELNAWTEQVVDCAAKRLGQACGADTEPAVHGFWDLVVKSRHFYFTQCGRPG